MKATYPGASLKRARSPIWNTFLLLMCATAVHAENVWPPEAGGPLPAVHGGEPSRRGEVREIGADTRSLLAAQREGTQAGPVLPIPGQQAALAYERYLNSFRFALPEFYTGQANAGTARSGAGGQTLGGK